MAGDKAWTKTKNKELVVGFALFNLLLESGEGREKGRKRNISVKDKHQLRIHPATQACALTGNWTSDLLLCGTMLNQLSHTGQGWFCHFLHKSYIFKTFKTQNTKNKPPKGRKKPYIVSCLWPCCSSWLRVMHIVGT